jgi:hypothetical protein
MVFNNTPSPGENVSNRLASVENSLPNHLKGESATKITGRKLLNELENSKLKQLS